MQYSYRDEPADEVFYLLTTWKNLDVCEATEQGQRSTGPGYKSKEQKLLGNLTVLPPFTAEVCYLALLQKYSSALDKPVLSCEFCHHKTPKYY